MSFRILLVEDNPGDALLIDDMLTECLDHTFTLQVVERLAVGRQQLQNETFDVVLLDLSLPDSQGLETFLQVQQVAPDMPVVVLTGFDDDSVSLEAVSLGAQDYLVKGQFDCVLLVRAITYAIERKEAQRRLRESEQKFRSLVKQSSDGIVLTDEAGTVIEWNQAQETITGIPPEEALGQTIWDIQYRLALPENQTPSNHENLKARMVHLLRTGEPFWQSALPTQELERPDGTRRTIQTSVFPIQTDQGYMLGAIVRDITDYRQTQLALQRRTEEINVLYEASRQIGQVLQLEEVYDVLHHVVCNIMVCDLMSAFAYDPDHQQIHYTYVHEKHRQLSAQPYPPFSLTSDAPAATAIRTGQTVLLNGQPHQTPTIIAQSVLTVPLYHEREVIGAIQIASRENDAFTPNDQQILEALAPQVATAITKAALYRKVETSQRFLQAAIDALDDNLAVINEAGTIIAVNASWRRFGDENDLRDPNYCVGSNYLKVCESTTGKWAALAHEVAQAMREMLANRLETFEIEYPCFGPRQRHWFSMRLTRFEQDGQPRLVVAHHNITTRVEAELAEREQRILAETLRDTATALARTLDPDEVMNLLLEQVGHVVRHDAANIMLIEDGDARIRYVSGYPPDIEAILLNRQIELALPTAQTILRTEEPVLVTNTQTAPVWEYIVGTEWISSHISLPIRLQDQIIGFLNVDSATPDFFDQEDVEHLKALVDQAAIAFQNAHTHNKLAEYTTELSTLHRVTSFLFTPLATAQEISDISRLIVGAVVSAFGQVQCGLLLLRHDQLQCLAHIGRYSPPAVLSEAMQQAIQTGEAIYRTTGDDPQIRSEFIIPLQGSSKVMGVLHLQSALPNALSERDRRVVTAFADRAATAIENVQLYSQIQRYTTELEQRVAARTQELSRAKEHVEAILASTTDAIILATTDYHIEQTNPAFHDMFGYDAEAVIGQSLFNLVHADQSQALSTTIQASITQKTVNRLELTALRGDGTTFDAELAVSVIVSDMTVVNIVCLFHNITRHKQIERSLRDALQQERELNELKSRFVSMASHEFRTPLATILSANDMLRRYLNRMKPEDIERRLNNIHEQVDHMTQLLEDVLLIGKIEAGRLEFNPEKIDIISFCRDVTDDFRQQVTQHIDFVTSGAYTEATVDKKLFRQILNNLLSNAAKYSPSDSTIYITVTCNETEVAIVVRDEGRGIPEKDQPRIFEAFHRANNIGTVSGTGLGLAITKQAVDQHNGTITFSSEVGVGTTFAVTLPM